MDPGSYCSSRNKCQNRALTCFILASLAGLQLSPILLLSSFKRKTFTLIQFHRHTNQSGPPQTPQIPHFLSKATQGNTSIVWKGKVYKPIKHGEMVAGSHHLKTGSTLSTWSDNVGVSRPELPRSNCRLLPLTRWQEHFQLTRQINGTEDDMLKMRTRLFESRISIYIRREDKSKTSIWKMHQLESVVLKHCKVGASQSKQY